MPLSPNQERELRQLLFAARHYLRLASGAREERRWKMGDTASDFRRGIRPSRRSRRLTLLGAHLSSAAIRLATVEKVLSRAGSPTDAYRECGAFYRGKAASYPPTTECLHVLLRDSIGHEEPSAGSQWHKRQDDIQVLSFADAHRALTTIEQTLRLYLKTEHGITLPLIGP